MKKYQRIQVSSAIALGTLASNTVIAGVTTADTAIDTGKVSSIVAGWDLEAHTAGEGPIAVGVAHSDYSATEILEYLTLATGFDRGDKIAQERQGRRIRRVGVFGGGLADVSLNDGVPIKTKLNWVLVEGDTIQSWALNLDGSSLTTGTLLNIQGNLNFWND